MTRNNTAMSLAASRSNSADIYTELKNWHLTSQSEEAIVNTSTRSVVVRRVPQRISDKSVSFYQAPEVKEASAVEDRPTVGVFYANTIKQHFSTEEKLQEWEGKVTDIDADNIYAELIDLTSNSDHAAEQITISKDEIMPSDLKHIRLGSLFRLIISYRNAASGRQKTSRLVFRRLPVWQERSLKEARAAAEEMYKILNEPR